MVSLFAFLVTHFFVLLGIFPGALVVVFSGTLGVRLAEGLVASSPGSQASGSLPRPGIQLQLKGSEMESRPGVPGRQEGRTGETADTVIVRPGPSFSLISPYRQPPSAHAFIHIIDVYEASPTSQALCQTQGIRWPGTPSTIPPLGTYSHDVTAPLHPLTLTHPLHLPSHCLASRTL